MPLVGETACNTVQLPESRSAVAEPLVLNREQRIRIGVAIVMHEVMRRRMLPLLSILDPSRPADRWLAREIFGSRTQVQDMVNELVRSEVARLAVPEAPKPVLEQIRATVQAVADRLFAAVASERAPPSRQVRQSPARRALVAGVDILQALTSMTMAPNAPSAAS